MRSRRGYWLSSLALLSLLAAPLTAQPAIPGAEQRVNERQNLTQRHPVAAFSAAGALVVWENDLVGLQGRLYTRAGVPAGPELTLVANQTFTSVPAAGDVALRKDPAIAMLSSGSFLLFWTEERGYLRTDIFFYNYELHSRAVFGQLFNPAGRPVGDPFRVDSGDAFGSLPQVAVKGDAVAVVWSLDDRLQHDKAALLRLYDARGRATSGAVRVSPAGEAATFPAVGWSAAGRLLVAWEGEDGNQRGIVAQVLDAAGSPLGASFRANGEAAGRQRRPAITAAGDDGFLVAWNGPGKEAGETRIFGQFVGAAGNLVGGQLAISDGAAQKELVPALAPGRDGHFLVAWLGYHDIFPTGIFAVELDALGAPVDEPVKLNRRALGANRILSVAGDGEGGFLIPWEGFIRRKAGISVQRASQP